jgi:hypothetical protein
MMNNCWAYLNYTVQILIYISPTEYKKSLKRDRDNARYEQNKDLILQRLRETRRQKKSTAVLKSGEHDQPDTPMPSYFAAGQHTVIMATDEAAVIQLSTTPTLQSFVS